MTLAVVVFWSLIFVFFIGHVFFVNMRIQRELANDQIDGELQKDRLQILRVVGVGYLSLVLGVLCYFVNGVFFTVTDLEPTTVEVVVNWPTRIAFALGVLVAFTTDTLSASKLRELIYRWVVFPVPSQDD